MADKNLDFPYETGFLNGFKAGVESAQPKWINAKEHVPADGVDVLVYRDGGFAIAHTVMDDCWTYTGLGGDPEYWMPLPKAPKEV